MEKTEILQLPLKVNILLNEFTNTEKEKLANIENGAQVNVIEKIFFNEEQFLPNENKELHITIDAAALDLNVLEGAQVPSSGSKEDVPILNKKLQLARMALTGDVQNLLQTSNTYITLDCGSSTDVV